MNLAWIRLPRSTRILAAALLLGAAGFVAAVHLTPIFEPAILARPSFCGMKLLTGYPCLACRGTRAAFALADGDVVRALRFNPLATLFLGVLGSGALAAAFTGRLPVLSGIDRPWATLLWCLLGAALLGNWAYVIAAGG